MVLPSAASQNLSHGFHFFGRNPIVFFEHAQEIVIIGKADTVGNSGNRHIGFQNKFLGLG